MGMPRPTRKHLIQAAARAVFNEQGYDRTRLQDVADRVGMLKAGIYAHYASKEDLYFSLLVIEMQEMLHDLQVIVEADLPAAEKLRQAVRMHITRSIEDSLRTTEPWRQFGPERTTWVRDKRSEYAALWERIIADGVVSGEFSPVDLRIGRLVTVSVAEHTLSWLRPGGEFSPTSLADEFVDLLLRGLGSPRYRRRRGRGPK